VVTFDGRSVPLFLNGRQLLHGFLIFLLDNALRLLFTPPLSPARAQAIEQVEEDERQ